MSLIPLLLIGFHPVFGEVSVVGDKLEFSDIFTVNLVLSKETKICTQEDLDTLEIYKKITTSYLKKYIKFDQFVINSSCEYIPEVSRSTYPLILMNLQISRPDLMIFVGDVNVNEDLVIHDEAYGVWACTSFDKDFYCNSNLIVVCNDCENPLYANALENGVWTLSHELAHFYFSLFYTQYYDGVHLHQAIFDMCKITGKNVCNQMEYYETISNTSFPLMDIDYIIDNFDHMNTVDIYDFQTKLDKTKFREYKNNGISLMIDNYWQNELGNNSTVANFHGSDYSPGQLSILKINKSFEDFVEDKRKEINQFIERKCPSMTIGNSPFQCEEPKLWTSVSYVNESAIRVYDFEYSWIEIYKDLTYDDPLKFVRILDNGDSVWVLELTTNQTNDILFHENLQYMMNSFEYKLPIIPEWIKNNAKWWSDGQVDDSTFSQGIGFLIKEKVISISSLPPQASAVSEEKIPDWIKNNAMWWADGMISEDEFLRAIKYMVENGIVKVNEYFPNFKN